MDRSEAYELAADSEEKHMMRTLRLRIHGVNYVLYCVEREVLKYRRTEGVSCKCRTL